MNAKAAAAAGGAVNDACFAADMRPALVQYFRRRCGNAEEAEDLAQDVAQVPEALDLLENHGYHKAVLFFSGRLSAEALLAKPDGNMRFAHAMALEFNGDRPASQAALRRLVEDTPSGYWPAETELLRMDSACATPQDVSLRNGSRTLD